MVDAISSQTLERRILGTFCKSRQDYEKVISELGDSYKESLSPIAQIVARLLEDYYNNDRAAESCPTPILVERARSEIHNEKHSKAVGDYCRTIDATVSVPNVLLDIRRGKKRFIGDKLASFLANHAESTEVDTLAQEYSAIRISDEDLGVEENGRDSSGYSIHRAPSVEDLVRSKFTSEGTISFGLQKLDAACDGGARAGHSILIFARPEVGKTLFTLHLIAHWLGIGKRVLYVGNEDPISDILLRIVGRLCRKKKEQILQNPGRADTVARQNGYDGFVGASVAPGTIHLVDKFVVEHKPDILVVDQVRNLDMKDENRVTSLEKAAIGIRNIAKTHGVIACSVTQAGESAEGRAYLGLSDIDFSKTGIPGAIDLAIGIGATYDDFRYGIRGISLPKNKLGGRHEEFTVRFDTETGEVEEC